MKQVEIAEKITKLWLFWEELSILFTLLQYITSKNLPGSLFREELPILLFPYFRYHTFLLYYITSNNRPRELRTEGIIVEIIYIDLGKDFPILSI